MKTSILLISDAAPGLPPVAKPATTPLAATPPPAPVLTCDPAQIAANLQTDIAALEKDAAQLPPLLGFALNSLRGALSSVNGHLAAVKKAAALLLLLTLLTPTSHAQFFNGGVTVTGTSNQPVLVSFVPITNTASSSLISRTAQIQNLVSNETFVLQYGYQWAGLGGTNLYIVNTLVTNFNGAGLTNGSTVLVPVPSVFNTVPIQPWGQAICTNNAGNVTNVISVQ
jgi:hypothetical protein